MSAIRRPAFPVPLPIASSPATASPHSRKLPDRSVDLVFADPPYNLQLDGDLLRPNNTVVDGVHQSWDKFASFADYDRSRRAWLGECRRVLKPDGALWVIGSYHNIFRLGTALQDLGYWLQNDVIWLKTNPMPNFRGKRFTNAHETLIWAARDQKVEGHVQLRGDEGVQRRPADALGLADPDLLGAGAIEGRRRPQGASDAEAGRRCSIACCWPPPTRATSCSIRSSAPAPPARSPRQLGRRFIGIERDRDYAKAAEERIAKVEPLSDRALETTRSKRSEPRIPFGTIVSLGMLSPGAALFDERRSIRAEVCADGTLAAAGRQGSIHRLGAEMQGKAACNGWTYWHFEEKGRLAPIDRLRMAARERLGLSGRPQSIAAE